MVRVTVVFGIGVEAGLWLRLEVSVRFRIGV